MTQRYEVTPSDDGYFDVIDLDTGEPVTVHGVPQLGFERQEAHDLAQALHALDQLVDGRAKRFKP